MVSIHGPMGHEPIALPLRHVADGPAADGASTNFHTLALTEGARGRGNNFACGTHSLSVKNFGRIDLVGVVWARRRYAL